MSVNYSAGDFDYENPQDNGGDNTYNFAINVIDEHGATASCDVVVNCTDVDDALRIVGGTTLGFPLAENEQTVYYAEAVGGYPPYAWDITGGSDGALFEIDVDSGVLTTRADDYPDGFDYENPVDSDSNNVYEVVIRVRDSTLTGYSQTVTVDLTVQDVDPENYPPTVAPFGSTPTVDWNSSVLMSGYVTVDDPDGDDLTVTLSSTEGQFIMSSSGGGLTFTTGAYDTAASTLVFSGILSSVQTALAANLYFVPAPNLFGTAHFEVTVDDGVTTPVTDSSFTVTVNQVRTMYLSDSGNDGTAALNSPGWPARSMGHAAYALYSPDTLNTQRVWMVFVDGYSSFTDPNGGNFGSVSAEGWKVGTQMPLSLVQINPQPILITQMTFTDPFMYGAPSDITLDGVAVDVWNLGNTFNVATPAPLLAKLRARIAANIGTMTLSGVGEGAPGNDGAIRTDYVATTYGESANASGSSGYDGEDGKAGYSLGLYGPLTIGHVWSQGSNGGSGGTGGDGASATAYNGNPGDPGFDDGMGTPADGYSGGNGGNAEANGGAAGNGGRAGDGGSITRHDGATVSDYHLEGGTGGDAGSPGNAGTAIAGAGGAGGAGVNGGADGSPGTDGTATALTGNSGTNGANGSPGSY